MFQVKSFEAQKKRRGIMAKFEGVSCQKLFYSS